MPEDASILELAPGAGRFTLLLAERTKRLTIVDLNEVCLDLTRRMLKEAGWTGTLSAQRTNGRSLPVADASANFIASYDSAVHFTTGILGDYLVEFRRVLAAGGRGFLHHAAIGETGVGWRSDVTTAWVNERLAELGMRVLEQEPYYELPDGRFNDCLTVFEVPGR